jgi:hypothetical protein
VGTSRFHCTAAYTRCLRCAGAPRRPTSGSELSLHIASCHAALSDPGEFEHRIVQIHDADMVFAMGTLARHSRYLHNPFHVGDHFGAARVHNCYGLTGCSPPRTDLTGTRFQPQEAFTSRLSTERSPLPSLDITTTSNWTPMSAGLPPAAMAASFAARSHRSWRADFPHHALRQLVHSFHCYLFKLRFHGQLIFSLNRRPCLPLNGAHVAQEQFNYR